ncbi:hypothetical protein FRC06_011295 [Ceratobasidium sp. 370]|nr:hypothetical protein FRC06_011295 [Ceratobasidium sp. 370]
MSGRGTCAGSAGEGITGGATTGADNATSTGARTSKATDGCTHTRTRTHTHTHTAHWGPTPTPATPNQEPEYRHLVEGDHTQHSDYIESLDPTALAAHLGQYITYDTSQLSTQDIKALLQAYLEDHSPSVASPKQQAPTVVISENLISVGGVYHTDQLMTEGPS